MRAIQHGKFLVLGILIVVSTAAVGVFLFRHGKSPVVPPEFAVLGDDPDGDGISTEEELQRGSNPLVADYPHLQFSFSDVEFGLRVATSQVNVEDKLSVRSNDLLVTNHTSHSQKIEHTHSEQSQQTSYSGGVALRAGPWTVPISYAGQHKQHTIEDSWRYQSTYEVRSDRLERISKKYQEQVRKKTESAVGPEAGYVKCRIAIDSSHPCRVEDFSVNIKVNGRILWTRPVTNDRHFKPLNLGKSGAVPDEFVLNFEGINTQEMLAHALLGKHVSITLEVPQSTVKLSEFTDPDRLSKTLRTIQSRCALVEISREGKSVFHYVSTAKSADQYGLPLDKILLRIPDAGEVQWAEGSNGSYLNSFAGQNGVGLFTPDMGRDGKWFVFHQGKELDGDYRERLVRPSDYLKLQYVRAAEFWGDLDDWKGYVEAYQAVRDVQKQENKFWTEVENYDTETFPKWSAISQQNVLEQGRAIHKRYQELLGKAVKFPSLRRYYPRSEKDVAEFGKWFTGNQVTFPTFQIRVTGAQIWWNIDKKIDPVILVKCNGKTIKIDRFKRDSEGRSGTLEAPEECAFEWTPFKPIELLVVDEQRVKNAVLCKNEFFGYGAAEGLIAEQPLDKLSKADSALSRVRLLCEVKHGDELIQSQDFPDYLYGLSPRIFAFVPVELHPRDLAADFWLLHHPIGYYRSAAIYEDLYRSGLQPDKSLLYLARAMVGYFRAFAFSRCTDLAREIPDDAKITVAMRDNLPKWIDVPGMRQYGAVAGLIRGLPRDGEAFRVLTRFVLHWQSQLRLEDILNNAVEKKEVNEADLKHWYTRLAASLEKEHQAAQELSDPVLRSFVVKHLGMVENKLRTIGIQLGVILK